MNHKVTLQQMIPLLFGLLVVGAIVLLVVNLINPPAIQMSSDFPGSQAGAAGEEDFEYERAADISGMRWQAMARFYKSQGLLTRDDFDYEQAADNMAYRWQAMAEGYEKLGLLNDRTDPGDVMAYRWLAMARAYEKMGLLNDK